MDKLSHYRQLIQKILTEYYEWASNSSRDGVEECLSFDEKQDHYFWFHVGWNGKKRVFGVMVYLRIQNDKIWVEEDWTKQGIIAIFRVMRYTQSTINNQLFGQELLNKMLQCFA